MCLLPLVFVSVKFPDEIAYQEMEESMADLTGKSVILTGASEGIGRALALELARRGARQVLAARNSERLASVCAECAALGGSTVPAATDVSDREACRALVSRAIEEFGRLDVLINNAGVTMWTKFEEVTELDIFATLMRVNYLGAVYLTKFALPHLKETQGRLVVVSSVAGMTGVPTRTGYSASKHAVIGFFDSLRIELAGTGVSVTNVAPDFVRSEIHRRAMTGSGEALGRSPLANTKIMSAETCARIVADATEKRRRLVITSARGRIGRWVRLVAPGLIDKIAARAIASAS